MPSRESAWSSDHEKQDLATVRHGRSCFGTCRGSIDQPSVRSEIRTVAEGLQGFREDVASEFRTVREEITELKAMIRLSFGELDHNVASPVALGFRPSGSSAPGLRSRGARLDFRRGRSLRDRRREFPTTGAEAARREPGSGELSRR